MKIEQGSQDAIGCNLENGSEISWGRAPKARGAIEISIFGQDKSTLRLRPVRAAEGEQRSQGSAGRDPEDVSEASGAAIGGRSVEVAVIPQCQSITFRNFAI